MAAGDAAKFDLEWQSFPASAGASGGGGSGAVPIAGVSGIGAPASSAPSTLPGAVAPLNVANLNIMSVFSPAFYKAIFNVDTVDVVARLKLALYPFTATHFLSVAGANPDMYGPLWVCATLVFVIGASANLASWLSFKAAPGGPSWQYDFEQVPMALFTVFGFSLGAPAILWGMLQYLGVTGLGMVQLLCVYGYSVAAFVPTALLSAVPSSFVKWLFAIVASLISSAFVLKSVWPPIRDQAPPPQGRALVLLIFVAQLTFGVVIKFYF